MRAIELAAIDAGEVTGLELMERAGRGVVEAIFRGMAGVEERRRIARLFCAGRGTMAATGLSWRGC